MKSRVEIEIRAPRIRVAELFADPRNNPKWMDDLKGVEELSGPLGAPASRYRLVSKNGKMDFTATVVARDLPHEVRLHLAGSNVAVAITDHFSAPSHDVTRLVSEEVFTFHGALGRIIGLLAQMRIRQAHRRHMESFKRFAEAQVTSQG